MNKLNVKRYSDGIINYISNNKASILTYMGGVGAVTTAVMAAKATPKALYLLQAQEELKEEHYGEPLTKFEKFLAVVPAYLPTILMGTATIACIFGADKIHKEREVALLSAYSYLNCSFNEYKDKVKELFGEDNEKVVRDAIAKDHLEVIQAPEDNMTLYDEYGKRYFTISKADYQKAIYDINKMYNFTGEMTLNHFYEFFKLEPVPGGDILGWSVFKDLECCGVAWIDVTLEPLETIDEMEVYVMDFNVNPSDDFGSWTNVIPF